jgi:cell wall-associated NlpC family hydrolase
MRSLHKGDSGEDVGKLQRAINKRLTARSAARQKIVVDNDYGDATHNALRYAGYLTGMDTEQLHEIDKHSGLTEEQQNYILHPGRRTPDQIKRGKIRVAAHRKALEKQLKEEASASNARKRIVNEARRAAANYREHPGAYHYLAGGVANTVYLQPTPRNYRSDCSQFAASVYKGAGVQSPAAPLDWQWASTYSIVKSPHARFITKAERKPGDLGMYGSRTAPHHVEIYCGEPEFIGHGSPPIDSLTPGQPDYYVTFDFLN